MEQKLVPAVETTLQVQLEQQLLAEVRATRSAVDYINIKLFGDLTVESEKGRFLQVESKTENHEQRISRLEQAGLQAGAQAGAYWNVARVMWVLIGAAMTALAGGAGEALIANALARH
jgi:Tfp pilus assembly PilM family ATPase